MMNNRIRLGLLLGFVACAGASPGAAQTAGGGSAAAVTPAAVAKGDNIYHKSGLCYACHGSNAEGAVGPNLTDAEWIHGDGSYDSLVATVTSGVPKEKSKSGIMMPPKGGSTISDDDVKAVAAYVYSLSHPSP
ncbi:MAG: c-type cytochrome [Gemmatimonadales bacterium]|nr:c-type cytochrome [Gemmatimonadales bacterium]